VLAYQRDPRPVQMASRFSAPAIVQKLLFSSRRPRINVGTSGGGVARRLAALASARAFSGLGLPSFFPSLAS
jgi:hypothetical protein